MKKLQLLILCLFVFLFETNAYSQTVIAEDRASNYSQGTFVNLQNLGTGFGAWHRVVVGADAAAVLETAANNGANSAVINTQGLSFGLRSSASDMTDQLVQLGRQMLEPLQDKQTLTFDLAWNWANPGLTGVIFYNGSWDAIDEVMVLDFDSAGYFLNGEMVEEHASIDDWDVVGWRQEGVALNFKFTQNGNDLNYEVKAITEQSHVDFEGTISNVSFDRFLFFNDGRPNWGNTGQGSMFVNSFQIVQNQGTSVGPIETASSIQLNQNYPNPFNPTTNISFTLNQAQHVKLAVYDALGREVMLLENGVRSAGEHTINFNAAGLHSGIYLYRLSSDTISLTRTMTLIK